LFDEYKVNESNYRRKLQAYRKAYPNFQYESPSMILEDSFDITYYNQYDAGPSGELPKVQSNVLVEMKGGNFTEVTKEQTMTYTNGQTT
jgi:predicted ester cyclase